MTHDSDTDGQCSPSLQPSSDSKRVTFASAITAADESLSAALLPHHHEQHDSHAHHTHNMSDQRLKDDMKQQYSSLAVDDDDDAPPPLEPAHHGHSHGGDDANHGHSHGDHGHSHAKKTIVRNSSSRSNTPTSPSTPKCGGMKNPKKASKAEEANMKARRQLGYASCCCCLFMVCEVIGGYFANSLAIMTDAAHLLSDLAGFLISIFALWLATRPATSRLSFGFHRAEIIGALLSVLLIWLLTGVLIYEAVWRVMHPEDVNGKLMFIVAAGGLVVNATMGMILMQVRAGGNNGAI